jgi:hypothetical protein
MAILESQYNRPMNPILQRNRINECRQKGDLQAYINEFQILSGGLSENLEAERMSYFIRGLRSATLQAFVVSMNPRTIMDAQAAALTMQHSITGTAAPAQHMEIDAASVRKNKKPPSPCRYCQGNHWNRECTKRNFNRQRQATVAEEVDTTELSFNSIPAETNKRSTPYYCSGLALTAAPTSAPLPIIEILLSQGLTVRLLVDSGASACFILQPFVTSRHLRTEPCEPVEIRLADGRTTKVVSKVSGVVSYKDVPRVNVAFLVLEQLEARPFDAILGTPWLRAATPRINWTSLRVSESLQTLLPVTIEPRTRFWAQQFPRVFSAELPVLPKHRGELDHAIDLQSRKTPYVPPYRLNRQEHVRLVLEALQQHNLIL